MNHQETTEAPATPEERRAALSHLTRDVGDIFAELPVSWFDPAAQDSVPPGVRQALAVLVEAIPGLSNVANGLQWTVKHGTASDLGDRMTSLGLRQLAHARHLAHVDECPALPED